MDVARWMTKNPVVAAIKRKTCERSAENGQGEFPSRTGRGRRQARRDRQRPRPAPARRIARGRESQRRHDQAGGERHSHDYARRSSQSAGQAQDRRNASSRPGKVVGIITATDLLRAFAEVLGGTQEGVSRIDLSLDGDSSELAMVVQLVAQQNGEILGMGSYQDEGKEGSRKVIYLRLRSADANRVARLLTEKNYKVLSIHL